MKIKQILKSYTAVKKFLWILLFFNLSICFAAKTNNSSPLSDNKVILNFENADIQSVIKAISKLSNRNFVIDPRVKGTINIVSDQPIAKNDSYKVLEAALRMQGFATIEANGVIKVLPESDAKTYGMKIYQNNVKSTNAGDQLITKIFIISHGSAMQMANALRPIISNNNTISVYNNANALIITDYASNINRVSKIINQLTNTQMLNSVPTIVYLKHALAQDIAQTIQAYIAGGVYAGGNNGGGGRGGMASGDNSAPDISATVDNNTNSIILYSTVNSRLNEIKALINELDNIAAQNNNNLHVVYLKNADADHIADVLRAVANNQETPNLIASSDNAQLSDTQSTFSSGSGSSSSGGGSSFGGGSKNNSSGRSNSNSNNSQNSNKILIQADPTTNSLIIQAPESIYRNLRMIINMLDIRRAQVMIEALIAEVNSSEGGQFGIQWILGAQANNGAGIVGLGNYGGGDTSLGSIATNGYSAYSAVKGGGAGGAGGSLPSFPNQLLVGLVAGTSTIGGQTVPNLGAIANAITNNNAGNILSRPTLVTLDNEEAQILVGSNIGIPSGSYSTTGGSNTVTPFSTYTRQDLGTMLKIKPLITQSGAIELQIYQEDSKQDPSTVNTTNPAGPVILQRKLRTNVLVDDNQIIVLGGMTMDSVTIQKNGIPLLMDIPLLGYLFSWQQRLHSKSTLYLFLKPTIIQNQEGYMALSNQRYQYVLGLEQAVRGSGGVLPTINPVTLDNQLPFSNNKIIKQNSNLVTDIPIIDIRGSKP